MRDPKDLQNRYQNLIMKRTNWDTRYQAISDHQLARADFVRQNKHRPPRDAKIYDGTAMDAWFMLTNAIQSILANVESNWLYLDTFDDYELNDEEILWLENAKNDLMSDFRNDTSRFPTQFNETIGDVTGYGTGGIHTGYDFRTKSVYFSSRPLTELYLDQDERGVIDTIYREYMLQNSQALRLFPDMEPKLKSQLERLDGTEEMTWVQTFEPHSDISGKVESQIFHVDEGCVVESETLEELPIHVGRWRTDAGQIYGTGPGVIADPFARTLNEVVKDWIIQSQKAVRPPLLVADDGVIGIPSTMPGTTTTISAYTPGNLDPVRPMDVGGDFRVADAEIVRLQTSIRRAYLHDILQITDNKELTAFHVQELTNRSQQWIAPVFQRLKVEIVQPMVERALKLKIRNGAIPNIPDSLVEKGIRVVYVSPAERASEIRETEATMRSVERAVAMAQVWPEVLDNFDSDQIARSAHLGFSADPKVLRPLKDVRRLREQRAQQQQNDEERAQAEAGAATGLAAAGQTDAAKILMEMRRGR